MNSTVDPGTNPDVGPEAEAEDPQSRRRLALKKSASDMIRSMLVILAIVVVIVLAVPRPSQTQVRAVDVASVARAVSPNLEFTPAVPAVPQGWTATSADVRNSADGVVTWHIGYLTAGGHYASVEQAAKVTPRWEEIMHSGGEPREPVTIDGTAWEQRFKDVRDVYALIHRGEARTTLVTSKGGGLENAVILARSIPVSAR